MSVSFEVRYLDQKGVLSVSGRVDSSNASEFETALFALLEQEPTGGVAVELDGLEYISSAGLRVVLMGAKRQRGASRAFAVCGLSENIGKVFAMSGFEKVIPVYAAIGDVP